MGVGLNLTEEVLAMGRTIEIVTFRLAGGVDEGAFLGHAEVANRFLGTCAGFVARRLSKGDDGGWVEHVEWESLAEAEEASRKFMEEEALKPFMAAIDPATVVMRHAELKLAVGA